MRPTEREKENKVRCRQIETEKERKRKREKTHEQFRGGGRSCRRWCAPRSRSPAAAAPAQYWPGRGNNSLVLKR